MPGVDLAAIMEAAVTEKLERLEAKRFGKTKNPRKSLEEADTSPGVRGISAPVRRFVWERDKGQCTFVSEDGRRCPAREGLEFDHDEPYGVGGDRSAKNIRLRCKTHNLYIAELYYGKEKMDRYRVREPSPTLELRPDGVDREPNIGSRYRPALRTFPIDHTGIVPRTPSLHEKPSNSVR